ncbi:MAG: hypothetical protein WBD16_04060 [Pyrinomonadaceae bacterium]
MKRAQITIALLSPVGCGVLFASLAIVLQDGYARGYASIVFLLWIGVLTLALAIAAVVVLSLGKGVQKALLLLASAFTFPATYTFILCVVRNYNGE